MPRRRTDKKITQCVYATAVAFNILFYSVEAFRVCGNFCGANWCNGGKRSEWTHDSNHCGPEYLTPQLNKKTGEPSCADACCQQHDMCCSPGGNDLPNSILLTKDCNKHIVECLAACDKMDGSCSRGIIPVPAVAVFAAMDLVQNWCCGSRCPKSDGSADGNGVTMKVSNLRSSNKIVSDSRSIDSGVTKILSQSKTTRNVDEVKQSYILSTSFTDEKCTDKDEISTVATLCNICQVINKTSSTIIRCLSSEDKHTKDGSNSSNTDYISAPKPYCSQEFYLNPKCTGAPNANKNISCDQSCNVFPVTKTNNDSTRGIVLSNEDDILSKMNYPIVKIYNTNDCSGDVLSYLGFGGCKPAPNKLPGDTLGNVERFGDNSIAKAWARVCKDDGLTYSCEYSDDSCANEIICYPLTNTKPGTCQNLTPSSGGSTSSQEWICPP